MSEKVDADYQLQNECVELESQDINEENYEDIFQKNFYSTPKYPQPPLTTLSDLPDLPLENIVKYLPLADLCNLALANRRLNSFALNSNLFSDLSKMSWWMSRRIFEKGITNFLSVPNVEID